MPTRNSRRLAARVPLTGLTAVRFAVATASIATLSSCASARMPHAVSGAWLLDSVPIVITPSGDDALRYRNLRTGASQRLYPAQPESGTHTGLTWLVPGAGWGEEHESKPSRVGLASDSLIWQDQSGTRTAGRVAIREVPLAFRSHDATLRGTLLLPDCDGPHPAVVIVHGSGRDAATGTYSEPWVFAANGVAAFVFDKRGTGSSGGKFTMDFSILADDVVQAVRAVRESGHVDANRIGLAGYSQGGWVAPLAASRTPVAFVLAAYGMIDSPADEDRAQTLASLRRQGFGEELARANAVIDAVHRIMVSDFREGWRDLDSLKRVYRSERWLRHMDAGFAGPFVRYPRWLVKMFKGRFPPGLRLNYESTAVLSRLEVPMLWLIAEDDLEAPPQKTLEWLRQNQRPNISFKVYPSADHGMLQYANRDGERVYTGIVPSYFSDQVRWVRAVTAPACRSHL